MSAPKKFAEFVKTVAALRHPKTGCPWDLKQTHRSLRRYMLEESYEAAYAMGKSNDQELCEELGDVLLQVVLNAQLAQDRGAFTIQDVVDHIDKKMKRRHPHVFQKKKGSKTSLSEVYRNWDQIKNKEKSKTSEKGLFSKKDLFSAFPAARASVKIGKKTETIGFDWKSPAEVFRQVFLEVEELKEEFERKTFSKKNIIEEMGDVYFTMAQLARHLKIDPEDIALKANEKFIRRFQMMEKIARQSKRSMKSYNLMELEELWIQAKKKIAGCGEVKEKLACRNKRAAKY